MANQSDDYKKGFEDGTLQEWQKCVLVCESWHSQTYIQGRYGNYGDYDLQVILKVATLIEEDIRATLNK